MQCFRKQPKLSKSQEILLVEESRKVATLNGQRLGLQDDHDLKFLLRGSHLLKVKSTSWRRERFYKLQEDCKTIWQESKKMLRSPESQLFSIEEIQDVRPGHKTEGMEKYAKDVPEVRCFSIIFKDQKKNLDLIAGSETDANHWVFGLGKIIAKSNSMSQRQKLQQGWRGQYKKYKNSFYTHFDEMMEFEIIWIAPGRKNLIHLPYSWIHACLRKADKNKDNKMSFKELKSFMKEVNIQMDDSYARQIFEQCDKSQTNTLEDEEIEVFYKILTERKEIDGIFSDHAEEKPVMSLDLLVRFLQQEQREENAGPELALSLIEQYEPNKTVKRQKAMSKDGFQMYLLSADGNVFNKAHGQVYQDMTQPLSHYYISSSHNTYLMEDQLKGPSSTEAYIRALMKGCRCVELDCWDGPNAEPVIYHGYTFTSKILFSDAIKAIKNYAFKISQYPVIISLENHCSLNQQETMARHLHSILEDTLLVVPIDSKATSLPSPEQLKGKILVKGKKLIAETEEVSDEDEAAEMEDETVKSEVEKKKLSDKLKLAKELSDTVIYCKSVHFQGFAEPQPHDEMFSFSEGKILKLAQESGIDLMHHNVQHLSRIYPAGWRTDSSNYNPVEMWNMGCQIVALNFQSRCSEMDIHQGRFQENGGCGYILKPEFLRDEQSKFNPKSITEGPWYSPKKFRVTIISGQQLPKVNKSKNSIVDPKVVVEIHGVSRDNGKNQTKVIDNNGFNPAWNETFEFEIDVPQLALVRFMVEDFDASTKNDFIGQFTAPFTSLKQGYRHIHLLTKNGDQYPSATLFVHINISDNC